MAIFYFSFALIYLRLAKITHESIPLSLSKEFLSKKGIKV